MFGSISAGAPPPKSFQKAMIFIDGTNLFYRLESANLVVPRLDKVVGAYVSPRELVRIYLYTIQQHLEKAQTRHGEGFVQGVRVVLGDGVERKDGNIKEKGVDALLVADLIYHAASKNCEYALIVTADTDFFYAIRRVEDFGCKTGVLSICCEAPPRLVGSCDDYIQVDSDELLRREVATRASL